MHLDSLKIKNFRLLEDVEVKKLGHVNLIVGKNNSGKSTVLEALALLASGFDRSVVHKLSNNRNINRHTFKNKVKNSNGIYFGNLFSDQAVVSKDVIYLGNEKFNLRIGATNNPEKGNYLDERYSFDPDANDFAVLKEQIVLDKQSLITCDFLIGSNRPLYQSNYEKTIKLQKRPNFEFIETSPIDIEELTLYWDKVALTDNELILIQTLQLIEPRIESLAFLNLSDELNFNRIPVIRLNGVESRVPLHQMGDGIFRLLQIILKVLKAKDGFLLIDEFENGLHYSVQPEVWRLIFELAKRFNIQVFATTHSWDCIESFAKVAKEREDLDGVLFRMGRSARKSDKGKVIATVYNEDELYYITKAKMEVR